MQKITFILTILFVISMIGCTSVRPKQKTTKYPVISEKPVTKPQPLVVPKEETKKEETKKEETKKVAKKEKPAAEDSPKLVIEDTDSEELRNENEGLKEELEVKDIKIKRLEGELAKNDVKKTKAAKKEKVTPVAKKAKHFYLRIISLPVDDYYQTMAKQIVRHLGKKGIGHATPRQSGKFWVVDIANVPSIGSVEADAFQKKIQEMKFQGRQQFGDAFYINY